MYKLTLESAIGNLMCVFCPWMYSAKGLLKCVDGLLCTLHWLHLDDIKKYSWHFHSKLRGQIRTDIIANSTKHQKTFVSIKLVPNWGSNTFINFSHLWIKRIDRCHIHVLTLMSLTWLIKKQNVSRLCKV